MPKLFAGSLIKVRDFTCQQIFGIFIFPTMGSQWNYSGDVALLGCTALPLVAHAKGQERVPVRCAVDMVTEDISHHLGKTCRSLNQTLPWTVPAASVVQPHPILGMVHFRRASSHPTLQHSSAQHAPSRLSGRQHSASPHHQRDRCSRSLLCFHSSGAGLAVPANTGSKPEVCDFILPPPFPPPPACERAGGFHQLWPAEWRSQSLLRSCTFCENHLRTQNLLTALGCCQTSILNSHWRIHTGAQPCQEIHGRPRVLDFQLTEAPVSSLIPLTWCWLCTKLAHERENAGGEEANFPMLYSLPRTPPIMLCLEPGVSTETLAPGRFRFIWLLKDVFVCTCVSE